MFEIRDISDTMADAIADFDWSKTSIGAIETWPSSLRAVVRMMLQQRHGICLFWGDDLNIIYNDAYRSFLGAKEETALGQPFREIWSDVWQDVKPLADQALSGKGTYHEDLRLVMQRNGFPEETFWTFSYSPLYDDDGRIAGLINVSVDTTALVQTRRKEALLRRELVHRVKNAMAVTSAVVIATMRHAETLEEARDTTVKRIAALGKAQSLLDESENGTTVDAIVRESIAAHLDRPDRLIAMGPVVRVPPQQAVGLSLAVYELATNALKYGALSNETGTISVSWSIDENDAFSFVWVEAGGPPVSTPTRSGFGTRLTDQIVANYFGGTGRTVYESQGVCFELKGTIRDDEET